MKCMLTQCDLDWLLREVDGWGQLRRCEAEEIVELALCAFATHGDEIKKPRHWLLAAAKRIRANLDRQQARKSESHVDMAKLIAPPGGRAAGVSKQVTASVADALQDLSDNHRAVVEMCIISDMTTAQAARTLNVHYETAKSWRRRAVQRLRRTLDPRARSAQREE